MRAANVVRNGVHRPSLHSPACATNSVPRKVNTKESTIHACLCTNMSSVLPRRPVKTWREARLPTRKKNVIFRAVATIVNNRSRLRGCLCDSMPTLRHPPQKYIKYLSGSTNSCDCQSNLLQYSQLDSACEVFAAGGTFPLERTSFKCHKCTRKHGSWNYKAQGLDRTALCSQLGPQ